MTNRSEIFSQDAERKSIRLYSYKISLAICSALQLDDTEMRKHCMGDAKVMSIASGYRLDATLAQLKQLASNMTRDGNWDLPPQTISACNRAARKLTDFITEKLREESAHTIAQIHPGMLKTVVSCSCGWSCGRDTSKIAREAHAQHALKETSS